MTVIDWLLDSDPSIRWQVMRDLTDAPADAVAAERARVTHEGWGAQLLALQPPDGRWPRADTDPEWSAFLHLLLLMDLGLDPASDQARRAVGLVRDNLTWHWWGDKPFFEGEVEPCINGRVATIGAYFGQDVRGLVDRLLGEQMEDGGWNCEAENGSTRGSFHTTICVLEGLLEHARATGGRPEVHAAIRRGHEYLLARRLLHRLSTGEVIDPAFARFGFPTCYHYDVLRALDHLRAAGILPDQRMTEAIAMVEPKRDADGRWPLEHVHDDNLVIPMEEGGEQSRWITLRALRVLRWAGRDADRPLGALSRGI
ncbi:MAG TPA: squalene cyclase [Pleomorphomonadaceae bacterium]|nr:squalene cyclase [Pleomorphomonadaceae bacterium]